MVSDHHPHIPSARWTGNIEECTCDMSTHTAGVILESEELHRLAYNAAFEEFNVRPKGGDSVANWSVEFYDKLQNSIGGGKPKMRWYFGKPCHLLP